MAGAFSEVGLAGYVLGWSIDKAKLFDDFLDGTLDKDGCIGVVLGRMIFYFLLLSYFNHIPFVVPFISNAGNNGVHKDQ